MSGLNCSANLLRSGMSGLTLQCELTEIGYV